MSFQKKNKKNNNAKRIQEKRTPLAYKTPPLIMQYRGIFFLFYHKKLIDRRHENYKKCIIAAANYSLHQLKCVIW